MTHVIKRHDLTNTTIVLQSYPKCGPPFIRSKTCAGLSSCLKRRRNLTPWLSPLFEFTKTKSGLLQDGGQDAFQKPGCQKKRLRTTVCMLCTNGWCRKSKQQSSCTETEQSVHIGKNRIYEGKTMHDCFILNSNIFFKEQNSNVAKISQQLSFLDPIADKFMRYRRRHHHHHHRLTAICMLACVSRGSPNGCFPGCTIPC